MIRLLVGFMLIDVLEQSHVHAADGSPAPLRMFHAVPDRVMNGRIGADSFDMLPHATADARVYYPRCVKATLGE